MDKEDIYLTVCCLAFVLLIWLANGPLGNVIILDQTILGVR